VVTSLLSRRERVCKRQLGCRLLHSERIRGRPFPSRRCAGHRELAAADTIRDSRRRQKATTLRRRFSPSQVETAIGTDLQSDFGKSHSTGRSGLIPPWPHRDRAAQFSVGSDGAGAIAGRVVPGARDSTCGVARRLRPRQARLNDRERKSARFRGAFVKEFPKLRASP
jgi:hypothetical protein